MKKLSLFLITLVCSIGFSFNTHATTKFEEGVHYKTISAAASSKPVVTEYFSFFCPHCYRFESAVSQIKQDLPEGVNFQKSHVDGTPLAPKPIQKTLSLALAVIDKMKLGNKLTTAIFDHLHKNKAKFNNEADIRALFVANGVDADQFDKAMKNFSVKMSARMMAKGWSSLPGEIRQIGVPSLVVNDKYWINGSKLRSREDYKAIIDFLIAKKD